MSARGSLSSSGSQSSDIRRAWFVEQVGGVAIAVLWTDGQAVDSRLA
ncbi:MAG: hypothetical protein ACRDVG_13810 [Jatrophihabitantaceae bacterium]